MIWMLEASDLEQLWNINCWRTLNSFSFKLNRKKKELWLMKISLDSHCQLLYLWLRRLKLWKINKLSSLLREGKINIEPINERKWQYWKTRTPVIFEFHQSNKNCSHKFFCSHKSLEKKTFRNISVLLEIFILEILDSMLLEIIF